MKEIVETCDICRREVSDVMRDGLENEGRGYIEVKRYRWEFGPWPKFWHREDIGWEIVCDFCLDEIKQKVEESLA